MRPTEVTREEIIEAGTSLQNAGINITGFALRKKVGGRGTPNRLKQEWEAYAVSQLTARDEPVAELPAEVAEEVTAVAAALSERISKLATELNNKAVKAAERRVIEAVRAADEQRIAAERELADAAQTVEELEDQLDASKAEAEELKRLLADAQANAQGLAVEIAHLQERLTAGEQALKAAAEQHGAELARAQEIADRYRAELDTARQDAADKIAGLRAEIGDLKSQAKFAEQSHSEQRKAAALDAARQTEQLTQAQAERDAARKEMNHAREAAAKQAGRLEALEAQNAELLTALKAKDRK